MLSRWLAVVGYDEFIIVVLVTTSGLAHREVDGLADQLVDSQRRGTAWRVLGQQVVFATLRDQRGFVHNVDSWDGYSATRDRIFDLWERRELRDNVILTGDVHSSWALDVVRDPYVAGGYDRAAGGDVWAAEFVTPGVTSRTGVPAEVVNTFMYFWTVREPELSSFCL